MVTEQIRTAAAAASVIPFACVICFDEFHGTERPPMVLPCGHTYVCLPCTKRLKRCMECREPLFLPSRQPAASGTTNAASSSSSSQQGRFSPNHQYNHHHPSSTPTKSKNPTPPVALPIPKNVVLLALMEAAERQKQTARRERQLNDARRKRDEDDDSTDDEDDDEEAFNLDHVITGMATLSGPCGTYAVRDVEGVPLYRQDPRRPSPTPPESVLLPHIPPTNSLLEEGEEEDDGDDDDDDNDMENEHEEKKQEEGVVHLKAAISPEEQQEEDEDEDQFVDFILKPQQQQQQTQSSSLHDVEILSRGQKLQVVSFEDGVAKLARGRGYVRATSSQLVKVGGPTDEACRVEGLLDTVRNRGRDLQATLDQNDQIVDKLAQQLQVAQAREPAQPVISDPPPENTVSGEGSSPTPDTPQTPVHHHSSMTTPEKQQQLTPQGDYPQREQFYTPRTDLGHYVQGGGRRDPHSPASIDNSDIMTFPGPVMPRYGHSVSFEDRENHGPYGASSFACGVGLSLEGAEQLIHRPQVPAPSWLRSSSSGAVAGGGSAAPHFRSQSSDPSNHLTPSFTSSFDGVDFRTGLSGHRGLSHARKLHNSPKPRSQIRMMGEHRGISHVRSRRSSLGHEVITTPTSSSATHSSSVTILETSPTFVTTSTMLPSHPPHPRPYSAVPALGPRFSSPGASS